MKESLAKIGLVTVLVCCSLNLMGSLQAARVPAQAAQAEDQPLEFRPQIVQLQGELLNSQAKKGGIRINFKGTALMPNGKGEVNAKSYEGSTFIQAKFDSLPAPVSLGEQYMIYVMWSMTAQGSPVRIGEMEFKDSKASLTARTALQALALFVTAEPYIEVSQPSNLVVLQPVLPHELPDANTGVMTRADLIQDAYAPLGYRYERLVVGIGQPIILRQALNARRIAQVARAEQFAPTEYREAESLYQFVVGTVLDQRKPQKNDLKNAVTVIREYEEARALSIAQQNRQR